LSREILLTQEISSDIIKKVICIVTIKKEKGGIMFYDGLTAELGHLMEQKRELTETHAKKMARKEIKHLERRLKKAATQGRKRLEIMRANAPFQYRRDAHYDTDYEAIRMAMNIVFQECKNRRLTAEIRKIEDDDCYKEDILIVSW